MHDNAHVATFSPIDEISDIERIDEFLENHSVNQPLSDDEKNTLLHVACFKAAYETIEYLLKIPNIDITKKNKFNQTPFDIACQALDLDTIAVFLETVFNSNSQDENTKYIQDYKERIFNKLKSKMKSDSKNLDDECTLAIHWACRFDGDCSILEQFLKTCRTHLRITTKDNDTLLLSACAGGNKSIVEKILGTEYFDINYQNEQNFTPLHTACQEGSSEVVSLLMKYQNIDVNTKDECNVTPLHIACEEGNTDIVSTLLSREDINLNLQNLEGMCPLHIACMKGYEDIVRQLLKSGKSIDVNQTTYDCEYTPLHLACLYGFESIVELLLKDQNIEGYAADSWLCTPMHYACQNRRTDIVELLLKESDVDTTDEDGDTPLHIAYYMGDVDTFNKLLMKDNINIDIVNDEIFNFDQNNQDLLEKLREYNIDPFGSVFPKMIPKFQQIRSSIELYRESPLHFQHNQYCANIANLWNNRLKDSFFAFRSKTLKNIEKQKATE